MVVEAISTINIPKGVEAGLGVVLIAVFLDRVTAALGAPGENRSSLLSMIERLRKPNGGGSGTASAPEKDVDQKDAADQAERETVAPRRSAVGGGGPL
ncbi:hypothetical protein ACU8V6_00095 [Vibrio alginolyticus]